MSKAGKVHWLWARRPVITIWSRHCWYISPPSRDSALSYSSPGPLSWTYTRALNFYSGPCNGGYPKFALVSCLRPEPQATGTHCDCKQHSARSSGDISVCVSSSLNLWFSLITRPGNTVTLMREKKTMSITCTYIHLFLTFGGMILCTFFHSASTSLYWYLFQPWGKLIVINLILRIVSYGPYVDKLAVKTCALTISRKRSPPNRPNISSSLSTIS